MKSIVAFFEIPASDFNRAVNFYETVLRLKFSIADCGETEQMAFFPEEAGKCPGAISFAANFNPSKDGSLISLRVDDMDAALSKIKQNNGKIITPKTKIEAENMGYFSVFMDSEGNRVGLYSDK